MQSLLANGHYADEEIKSKLDSISSDHHQLLELWEQRHKLFSQCYQLQVTTCVYRLVFHGLWHITVVYDTTQTQVDALVQVLA